MQNRFVSVPGDEEIIALYWARDEHAIRATDDKYGRYLFGISQNILHNEQDSEECLNDTYVGAWNAMPPHKPSVLQAFLSSMIRRISISLYRKKHRQKRGLGEAFSLTDFEDFIEDRSELYSHQQTEALGQTISDWLRTLSERQRYVFISRYHYAKPVDSITRELGCSKSTVNKEIAAIKQSLRAYLAKEGYLV